MNAGDYTEEDIQLILDDEGSIWEKQVFETEAAYRAFKEFYLGLDRSKRTVANAYREYCSRIGKSDAERATGRWYEWCKRNQWENRANAYDFYIEETIRDYAKKEQYLDLVEFRKRQREISTYLAKTAKNLIIKAYDALEQLDIDDLSPAQIANYVKTAASVAEMSSNAEATALALDEIVERMAVEEEYIAEKEEVEGELSLEELENLLNG